MPRARRLQTGHPIALAAVLLAIASSDAAGAAPLDLDDTSARWIAVRFEISPPDRPEQLRTRFTPRLPARLEPTATPGELRIVIDGALVERHLMTEQKPEIGSFDDFVWLVDAGSGHVRSAAVSGTVVRDLGWGFARWRTATRVQVRLDTLAPVYFQRANVLGEPYLRICDAEDASQCTRVTPVPFERASGYVNAVGSIAASTGSMSVKSFAPIGEAEFSEIGDPADPLGSRLPGFRVGLNREDLPAADAAP